VNILPRFLSESLLIVNSMCVTSKLGLSSPNVKFYLSTFLEKKKCVSYLVNFSHYVEKWVENV